MFQTTHNVIQEYKTVSMMQAESKSAMKKMAENPTISRYITDLQARFWPESMPEMKGVGIVGILLMRMDVGMWVKIETLNNDQLEPPILVF